MGQFFFFGCCTYWFTWNYSYSWPTWSHHHKKWMVLKLIELPVLLPVCYISMPLCLIILLLPKDGNVHEMQQQITLVWLDSIVSIILYLLSSNLIQSNTSFIPFHENRESAHCTHRHTTCLTISAKKNGIMQSTASIETTMMAMTCILTVANVCERRKKPNHKISVWNRGTSSCRTFAWFTRSMHVHLSIVR